MTNQKYRMDPREFSVKLMSGERDFVANGKSLRLVPGSGSDRPDMTPYLEEGLSNYLSDDRGVGDIQGSPEKIILRDAELKGLVAKGIVLSLADFEGANLEGVAFEGADLSSSNLRNANLDNSTFNRADFSRSDLTSASFDMANLRYALFEGTNLDSVKLRRADLYSIVDLDKAKNVLLAGFDGTRMNRSNRDYVLKLLSDRASRKFDLAREAAGDGDDLQESFMPIAEEIARDINAIVEVQE